MRKILLLSILFLLIKTNYAQIKISIDPIGLGQYNVASTDLTHDNYKIDSIITLGYNVGSYWEGDIEGKKYVTDLLSDSSGAIEFNVIVPNDSTLYGEEAGNELTYAAIIYYPTTANNSHLDYELPGGKILPKMQRGSEEYLFSEDKDKFPLLIYSHGRGSHPVASLDNLKYFASHGFIVAALFHSDKRVKSLEGSDLNSAQEFALRPLAVLKLIDMLQNNYDFKDKIDNEKIAAFGESYGGSTVLALLGGKIIGRPPFYFPRVTTIDERIKCGVGIVAYVGNNSEPFWGVNNTGLNGIERPFFLLAAENDGIEYSLDAISKLSGEKYMVKFNGLGHNLGEGAGEDYSTWALIFLKENLFNDNDAKNSLYSATSISNGADDEFIPVDIPEQLYLSTPPDGVSDTTTNVDCAWLAHNKSNFYKFELSDDAEFNNILISADSLITTTFSLTNLVQGKIFYWHTKGVNNVGSGDWSATFSFTIEVQTGIDDNKMLKKYNLTQNYPNPFNPTTTIQYSIPVDAKFVSTTNVVLKVYDILGREVATLVNKEQSAGNYEVRFDASGLSSGLYCYKLNSGSYSKTMKMLLLK